jgi:hypothetical protein
MQINKSHPKKGSLYSVGRLVRTRATKQNGDGVLAGILDLLICKRPLLRLRPVASLHFNIIILIRGIRFYSHSLIPLIPLLPFKTFAPLR